MTVFTLVIQKESMEEATEVFVRTFATKEKAKEEMEAAIQLEIDERPDEELKQEGSIEPLDVTLYDDNGGSVIFSVVETELE